jgi:glucan phosphoethanolaminetransferase (alkaline phosphatase superfamily)
MADCVTVGRPFLTHSFALAIATSYIASLVTWFTLGKPGIGTSIYTVFMLASAAYVALYLIATLLRRPRHLRRLPTRHVIMVLSLLVVVVVDIAYSIYKFLPPTTPHLIGLVLTVTTLTGYHVIRHKAKTR